MCRQDPACRGSGIEDDDSKIMLSFRDTQADVLVEGPNTRCMSRIHLAEEQDIRTSGQFSNNTAGNRLDYY